MTGGSGEHPDKAAHEALGLSGTQHTHPDPIPGHVAEGDPHVQYALDADLANHEGEGHVHDHDGTYEPVHAHPYAATSHSHVDGDIPAGIARDAEVAAAYSPLGHTHAGGAHPDLSTHDALGLATDAELTAHAQAADPHPGYLTPAEGNAAYSATGHAHAGTYEPAGTVATHAAAGDPHPGYLTSAEGNAAYSAVGHTHPGGGSSPWTLVIKTADESKNNSAAVADDNTLVATLLANTQYAIRLRAFFLTNATADLKYRLVFSGTTTRVRRRVYRTATTDTAQTIALLTAFDAADVVLSTTGLNPWLEEHIVLQVGASGGTLVLRWGQVASNAGPTTCLEGSYLEYALS